ncbi:MAG: hypothetical protein AAGB51_12505 [Planctomycetota bacterium]
MDDRQTQIREGAGLEESRINEDFLRFVGRWGAPVVVILAVSYAAWSFLKTQQAEADIRRGDAYAEFEAARSVDPPNPDALLAIAADFEGVAAVSHLARIEAADTLMREAIQGVRFGAELDQSGAPFSDEDLIEGETFNTQVTRARDIYERVLSATERDRAQALIAVSAGFGLAAAQESLGDYSGATGAYERVARAAERAELTLHVGIANQRIASMGTELERPALFYDFELPPDRLSPSVQEPALNVLTPRAGSEPEAGPAAPDFPLPPESAPESGPDQGSEPEVTDPPEGDDGQQ